MTYVPVKRGDSHILLEIELLEDNEPCDLTTAESVKAVFSSIKKKTAEVLDPPNSGIVTYELTAEDLAVVGFFRLELEVTFTDGAIVTFPSDDYILLDVVPDRG